MKLTTETCQHGTSKSVMCLFCEAYNAAWTAALTEAAKVLEAEVERHMKYTNGGKLHHTDESFCEDYGHQSLAEFAQAIRALAGR